MIKVIKESFILIFKIFMLVSVVLCISSLYSNYPLMARLLLVLSVIFLIPALNIKSNILFAFYICIAFLSGVLVLLSYLAGIRSYFYKNVPLTVLGLAVLSTRIKFFVLSFREVILDTIAINTAIYLPLILLLLCSLILFLCAISEILTHKKGLRKF